MMKEQFPCLFTQILLKIIWSLLSGCQNFPRKSSPFKKRVKLFRNWAWDQSFIAYECDCVGMKHNAVLSKHFMKMCQKPQYIDVPQTTVNNSKQQEVLFASGLEVVEMDANEYCRWRCREQHDFPGIIHIQFT